MKTLSIAVGVVITCCACQKAADRTNTSPTIAGEDLKVSVQWPEGKRTIQIPIEFLDDTPIVRCRLNGKEAVLLVDTGCQPICLYEDRLNRHGLKVTAEKDHPRYTASGRVASTRYCGRFLLTCSEGLSMDVSGAPCVPGEGRQPSHEVDGLLGVKIMKALNGVIDLEAGKITFAVKMPSGKAEHAK